MGHEIRQYVPRATGILRRTARFVLTTTLSWAVLTSAARTASATDEFPGVVQDTWKVKLPNPPGCKLCHADDSESVGKHVTTRVGMWFFGQGLRAFQTSTLKTLLATSKSAGQDTDGDGVSDYQELVDGTDPNDERSFKRPPVDVPVNSDGGVAGDAATSPPATPSPGPPPSSPPLMQTGCSARSLAARSTDGWFVVGAAIAGAVAMRRRRAGATRRPSIFAWLP